MNPFVAALVGGVVIGLSTSLLLLFKGRVFGISGILGGVIKPSPGEVLWRVMILAGLVCAGFVMAAVCPEAFPRSEAPLLRLVIAGLLVGFGTQLGGGCTSGHGVCGISRLSPRSITATLVFMAAGFITVYVVRVSGGL